MASLYVRDMVRSWLADPGMTLPFVDTINREVDPQLPAWATVLFIAASVQLMTYCGDIEERGAFDYLALGKPGEGDAELLAAAEHDVALLMRQADPAARLTLVRAGAAEDFLQAGRVPWYSVSLTIEYSYIHAPALIT